MKQLSNQNHVYLSGNFSNCHKKFKLRFLAGFLPLPPLLVFFLFFRSGFLGLSWALFLGSGMFCIGCKEVTTVLLEPGKERLGRNVELLEHRRLVRGLLQLHWGDHGAPDESHGQDLDLKKGSLGQGGPHTRLGDACGTFLHPDSIRTSVGGNRL